MIFSESFRKLRLRFRKKRNYVSERRARCLLPGHCDLCGLREFEHQGGYDRHVFIDNSEPW